MLKLPKTCSKFSPSYNIKQVNGKLMKYDALIEEAILYPQYDWFPTKATKFE